MGGSGSQLQIIGMSATLPNVDQVAAWLDAVLYQTDFRPVQLKQYIKLGRLLKDQEGQVCRLGFWRVTLELKGTACSLA
jgi:DNA polymerase theta